nr:MAG TPA: hypothetical protein [Caudoviricetes sp.]
MVLACLKQQRFLQTITSILLSRSLRICRPGRSRYSSSSRKQKLSSNSSYSRCRMNLSSKSLCYRKLRWIFRDIRLIKIIRLR